MNKIEMIAIAWVCPNGNNPTTPYEVNEVKRLTQFAENVIFSLSMGELREIHDNMFVVQGSSQNKR